eukprot:11601809-Alexandrium_andersonii.AAC.1
MLRGGAGSAIPFRNVTARAPFGRSHFGVKFGGSGGLLRCCISSRRKAMVRDAPTCELPGARWSRFST